MPQVPAFTPNFGGPANFARQVFNAYRGHGLSEASAALLTAHAAVSTGWGRSAPNYALSGVKAGSRDVCYGSAAPPAVNYFCSCTFEYQADGSPAPGCSDCEPKNGVPRCKHPFVAYADVDAATAGVLKALNGSRYASARAMLAAGDPEYFAEVGRNGWYTANVAKTAADMRAALLKVQEYLKLAISADVGFIGVVLALGLGWIAAKTITRNR